MAATMARQPFGSDRGEPGTDEKAAGSLAAWLTRSAG